jgi:preprotein translocase subunit SecB
MSNIKILGQYIKDLSFEVPLAPDIFLQENQKPDINLSIDIDAKKITEEGAYEVTLKISAEATAGEQKVFICEAAYSGIFLLTDISNDEIEEVLLIYCPNILFPFIRRIITHVVIDGGFPPLMIEPINFADLYQKRQEAVQNQSETSTAN